MTLAQMVETHVCIPEIRMATFYTLLHSKAAVPMEVSPHLQYPIATEIHSKAKKNHGLNPCTRDPL